MLIKLNSMDTLQLAKAIKGGYLDTDKVRGLKWLVEGYNPPARISQKELKHYLKCLFDGWGYKPTDSERIEKAMLEGLDIGVLERWEKHIESGYVYAMMIKTAFLGLVAIRALGGTFIEKEGSFDFM